MEGYKTTDRSSLRFLLKRRVIAHVDKYEYLVVDTPNIMDLKISVHWSENRRHATVWDCGATAIAFAGVYTLEYGAPIDIEVHINK